MIHASSTWNEVELKLAELRSEVNTLWDRGDWQNALKGEKLIKSVMAASENAAAMRRQGNKLIAKLELIEAYQQFPLA